MPMKALSRSSSHLAIAGGLIAAALFWAIDLFVECHFLQPGRTCLELLLHPGASILWIRFLASATILLLIFQSTLLLRRHEEAEAKLSHSSFLIQELSVELNQKNANLIREAAHRKEIEKRLDLVAVDDPVTGIHNRHKFDELLNLALRQEARYPRGLVLLMLDVDRFREVNDHYGQAVGDEVLKELAQFLAHTKRDADDLFRIGGDEFALITFCAADDSLDTITEKMLGAIAGHAFPIAGRLTVCIGVTRYQPGDSPASLYNRADDALYQAKQTGRNEIVAL